MTNSLIKIAFNQENGQQNEKEQLAFKRRKQETRGRDEITNFFIVWKERGVESKRLSKANFHFFISSLRNTNHSLTLIRKRVPSIFAQSKELARKRLDRIVKKHNLVFVTERDDYEINNFKTAETRWRNTRCHTLISLPCLLTTLFRELVHHYQDIFSNNLYRRYLIPYLWARERQRYYPKVGIYISPPWVRETGSEKSESIFIIFLDICEFYSPSKFSILYAKI